jgi:hypothetical protein
VVRELANAGMQFDTAYAARQWVREMEPTEQKDPEAGDG